MSTWMLVLLMWAQGGGGQAVDPHPYPTREACEAVGEQWRDAGRERFRTAFGYECLERE